MRSKRNHSRQRKLPVKPIKPYKGGGNVERKIIGTSGYYVGFRIKSWNKFLDGISYLAIVIGIVVLFAIMVFIATLPIWV